MAPSPSLVVRHAKPEAVIEAVIGPATGGLDHFLVWQEKVRHSRISEQQSDVFTQGVS